MSLKRLKSDSAEKEKLMAWHKMKGKVFERICSPKLFEDSIDSHLVEVTFLHGQIRKKKLNKESRETIIG